MDREVEAESNSDEIREIRERIERRNEDEQQLIASLNHLIPDLLSSLNHSLRLISTFNRRQFTPIIVNASNANTSTNHHHLRFEPRPPKPRQQQQHHHRPRSIINNTNTTSTGTRPQGVGVTVSSTHLLRSMLALSLLDRLPFTPIDSSTLLRKLENHPTAKSALRDVGGDSGSIFAVELTLSSMSALDLEEFVVSGKSRLMVMSIDRPRLLRDFPQTTLPLPQPNNIAPTSMPRPDIWPPPDPTLPHHPQHHHPQHPHPPLFRGRGVPINMNMNMNMNLNMNLMMGPRPQHRPHMPMPIPMPMPMPMLSSNSKHSSISEDEDVMKDVEALLNKKSFKEMQKSKTGEELLDLIHRPTARETAVAAKFKTKGGPQLKEYCSALTKEDCRQKSGSYIACEKVHFRRIIAPHTDINLGDCSFLDTCRHMKTCKYVHYELDPTPDVSPMMMASGTLPPPKPIKTQRAEYCSQVELGEPQWINCDIRNFRMDILGQFGVIMADPPWDIHMELPYGTMADDEMRTLNVPALQTDGLIFLWVTGRAMELGRECLELWGYKRVEEIIWVKTNQLQRIIRTGRTGHWLNHSKEHCLVGIKGNPEVNRNIDTDVIVAEVRETSRKPDEMYPLLERISPRTRKLELFARMHNTHAGWLSLGNQLNGARLVDEGLRARFKAAYPDVEIQPPSPPRSSAMEIETPFSGVETKSVPTHFPQPASADAAYVSEEKSSGSRDVEMMS